MDEVHFRRLHKGVGGWNRWRARKRVFPDLSKADLHAMALQEINFHQTNLAQADLSKARLAQANMQNCNGQSTRLHEANLSSANLSNANFQYANLERADLRSAFLIRTNLRGANLSYANVERTNMMYARAQGAQWEGIDIVQIKHWSTIAGVPVTWPVEVLPGLLRAQVTCQAPGCSEFVLCLDLVRIGVVHPEDGLIERLSGEGDEIVGSLIYTFDEYHRHTGMQAWPIDGCHDGSLSYETYALAEQAFLRGDFAAPCEYLGGDVPFYCRTCKKIYCNNHTSQDAIPHSNYTGVDFHIKCPEGHFMMCLFD